MADEDPKRSTYGYSSKGEENPITVDETVDEPSVLIRADDVKQNMEYIDRNEIDKFKNLVSGLPKKEQIQIIRRLLRYTGATKTRQLAELQQTRIKELLKLLGISDAEFKGGRNSRKTRKPKYNKRKITRRR